MAWGNLTEDQFVSFNDAKGSAIKQLLALPTSDKWMTKNDVINYLNCDTDALYQYYGNEYVRRQHVLENPTKLLLHFDGSVSSSNVALYPFGSPPYSGDSKFGSYCYNGSYTNGWYFDRNFLINILNTGNFTIEFWGKRPASYGSYPYTLGVGIDDGTANGFGFRSGWDKIQFGNYSENPSNYLWAYYTDSWYKWNHFAVTCEDGYVRLFVNGSLKIGGYITWTYPNVAATIGGRQYNNNVLSYYYIDELRISSKPLWISNFTPSTIAY